MTRTRKTTLFVALAMLSMLMVSGLAFGAEKYPTKPIQAIVPVTAGGSSDLTGRALRLVQTGNLQTYAFLFVLGVALLLYFVLGK